jgi:ribosomal protein S14
MKRQQTDAMAAAVRAQRHCSRCGSRKALHAHHLVALADGGE